MRVIFKIYRTAKVPTGHLKGAVGLELNEANDKADLEVKKKFGPHMAPGFRIFWPETPGFKTTLIGMEAMGFDVGRPEDTPEAPEGIVTCDPISPEDTARIDGALRSELMRLGLWTEADDYEWRGWYQLK